MTNLSIHPRNWADTGNREIRNTRRPSRKATIQQAIDGTERHLESHPNDAIAKRRVATFTTRLANAK